MIKHTRMILLTILFAGGLLWLVLPPITHAAADIEVSVIFGPEVITPTNSLKVGDVFTAQVQLASVTDQFIDTYGFYMTYSQTVVSVTNVSKLYTINGFEFCPTPLGFDNATGRIVGECSYLGGGNNSDGLALVEITFEVMQTNDRFDLLFDQVCDGAGNAECFQLLSSGVNQVATYNDASNTPTAVHLLDLEASHSSSIILWGSMIFVATLGSFTLLRRKRQRAFAEI